MLLEEDMISGELVENMRSWKHSGFSVHCGTPIQADETDSRKTLSEYISRAPFSLERMSFNEGSKTVVYRGELSSHSCEELRCFWSPGIEFLTEISIQCPFDVMWKGDTTCFH